ncbi:MAG: nuclear transport factor 2 family protein [Clostridia bacterium]|nr:nuclear transport factor 2 family protein [Clostridia bacterium]
MTNKEKALALIGTFVSGDLEKAKELLAPEYKQHNLAFGTGADAFVEAVAGLQQAPVKTTVNNIRAFEDGDYVFLHTVYNFAGAGEQVAFDIFHFNADGKIDEHWDNLQDAAAPNPSGHTQIDGTTEKKDVDKEETRKVVAGFVGDVLRGENPDKLISYYDGDRYIQHNVSIADGLSGLGAALAAMAEQGIAMVYDKTWFVLADGDYALAASSGSFGGTSTTYYDLFRVENGFIAEHWDVMETVAAKDTWKNQNGKF